MKSLLANAACRGLFLFIFCCCRCAAVWCEGNSTSYGLPAWYQDHVIDSQTRCRNPLGRLIVDG